MPGKSHAFRSTCPISMALDMIGDSWSLLIIRDVMFKGIDTFNGFLGAGEGIATNILTERLSRLECFGFIERRKDARDRRRFRYSLTQKGADLAPVLVQLVLWSSKYEKTGAPEEVVAAMSADPQQFANMVIDTWRKQNEQGE